MPATGEAIHVRECEDLTEAYLYATSPHMFEGDTESAFGRVREQASHPLSTSVTTPSFHRLAFKAALILCKA